MIGVEDCELVAVGDDFQFKGVALGPVVAPEVIVVVDLAFIAFEGEAFCVPASYAFQS